MQSHFLTYLVDDDMNYKHFPLEGNLCDLRPAHQDAQLNYWGKVKQNCPQSNNLTTPALQLYVLYICSKQKRLLPQL